MKILLCAVGRLKEDYLRRAEAEYLKRLRPLCKLEIREVGDEAALLKAIPERARLCLFDERGELLSSEELARDILERHAISGGGETLAFAIGGAEGHSDALRRRADRLIAFGRLTIAHRLVRILALEQIYRGLSIVRGLPYHRGG
jgi:23S rRNA (pseudouridine1915-N3)-methyltransferase